MLLLVPLTLAATLPSSLERRCEVADVVVVAEVTGSSGEPDQALGIHTRWDVAVEQVLKGGAPASVVTPGGVFAGLRLDVSEAAPLRVDRAYLLFLRTRPDGSWVMGVDGAVPLAHTPAGADWEPLLPALGACAPRR